ncbi:hypothetical protein SERLADRAFT_387981 [Serpula lacrymans var. lacrymans S7.9]|uniref:Uncharacterized protein n=1 Tax=Serpula lacrymans var. lacrymans (strain S7.9) TaxID=578457 RepID=F8NTI6_SERL9|nr:uncharacterized protein SERLADRAFT_387981 [Serpula lacrymans var. lacrymans S7.9]EGO25658.1 hypothetical protein SERLADRAFT_387981 [Serpula lacrymans var. lacrymans S7.9]
MKACYTRCCPASQSAGKPSVTVQTPVCRPMPTFVDHSSRLKLDLTSNLTFPQNTPIMGHTP